MQNITNRKDKIKPVKPLNIRKDKIASVIECRMFHSGMITMYKGIKAKQCKYYNSETQNYTSETVQNIIFQRHTITPAKQCEYYNSEAQNYTS